MWVADYTSRIDPAQLAAAGVVGVCRYVSRFGWKVIDHTEYAELVMSGLFVVLNFEDESNGWMGGAAAGAADADFAAAAARAVGYPSGWPLPSSADFDMTAAQWAAAGRDYAVAYRDGLIGHGFRPGVYGPSDVLAWCKSVGYDWFWQCMSTDYSQKRNADPWPGAHLQQTSQRIIGGSQVDYNKILRTDWTTDMLTDDEHQALMAVRDAMFYGGPSCGPVIPGAQPLNSIPGAMANSIVQQLAVIRAGATGSVQATQDQISTAVAGAMNDPAWIAKLAAAIAGHVHVS